MRPHLLRPGLLGVPYVTLPSLMRWVNCISLSPLLRLLLGHVLSHSVLIRYLSVQCKYHRLHVLPLILLPSPLWPVLLPLL
ncbi:hypothetical protein F5878DRAFT_635151 [Lentinula raphanica]|uniref:Uncharacterized protein n=1 Tax=Lentinula raphanica TaxID=153919 RepID=A0AA38NXM4_9AGAR|nr:hypothetical protein F5878DRAFT_635151 [Lentinula raphanica]